MCCSSNVKQYWWATAPLWAVWGTVQAEEVIDISPAARVWCGATVSLSTLRLQSQTQDCPLNSRVLSSWLHSGLVFTQGRSLQWGSPVIQVCWEPQFPCPHCAYRAKHKTALLDVLLSWLHSGLVFTQSSRKPDHWERIYHFTDIIILS